MLKAAALDPAAASSSDPVSLDGCMTDAFEPVSRPRRLPDEIAASILDAIARGDYGTGDRLPTEMELSQRFNVARTVVREAVSLLKFDGVITARQGVGAFVSSVSSRRAFRIGPACFAKRRQLLKLLALRTSVQSDAAAAAAAGRSDEQLAAMRAALDRLAGAMQEGLAAAETRVDAESAFYGVIAEASGNEYFVEFIQMIDAKVMENLRSVVIKNALVSETGASVLAEHEEVLSAVREGNSERARAATRRHFESAARRLADRADFADV